MAYEFLKLVAIGEFVVLYNVSVHTYYISCDWDLGAANSNEAKYMVLNISNELLISKVAWKIQNVF